MNIIYDEIVVERGGFPELPATVTSTKRDQGKAWRLTNRVADALIGDDPQVIAGVTVYPIGYREETQ